MSRTAVLVLTVLMTPMSIGAGRAQAVQQGTPDGEWRTFSGSWSARGQRQVIPTEGNGSASIVHLSGAVVLGRTDLEGGMLGEVIAFDDGQRLGVGRAVWTDTRGDHLFSELRGEPVATGRRIVGTITGGTGRYAGVTGDYALTWQ